MEKFKQITIAGGGVLGAQIAFQTALHGYDVFIYDISEQALLKTKETIEKLKLRYKNDLGTDDTVLKNAQAKIRFFTNLAEAVKSSDLVIEAIPENPKIKLEFYHSLSQVAPEKTIFATNSSTLLPSQFAEVTGRPEKFLALHFANEIWTHNTAEIMGHSKTSTEVFDSVVAFAKSIGMVALPLNKEQPGYILNSLLVPLLAAAT